MSAETSSRTPPVAKPATRSFGPGMRWIVFAGIAFAVVALDQLAKLIVTANLDPGQAVEIVGDYLRIVFGQNSGALFGLFQDNALVFGIVSLAVIALIVGYHARSTRSAYLTITLGLLLGGALGNMVDRLRLGYVVDFVDAGIGATRFYTFNVADSAISLSILLLFIAALRPSLIEGAAPPSPATTPQPRPQRSSGPLVEGEEDPWDEDVAAGPGPGAAG
ncbi:MAG TPA: signal peptidase II [Candidatus Limnocylindrales bacterium]